MSWMKFQNYSFWIPESCFVNLGSSIHVFFSISDAHVFRVQEACISFLWAGSTMFAAPTTIKSIFFSLCIISFLVIHQKNEAMQQACWSWKNYSKQPEFTVISTCVELHTTFVFSCIRFSHGKLYMHAIRKSYITIGRVMHSNCLGLCRLFKSLQSRFNPPRGGPESGP